MIYSEENWPKVKKPGSMKDPVFAALHMTNLRWMRALGHNHYSFTDPERNVRLFKKALMREARTVIAIMGLNQRTRATGNWKPYLLVDSVHKYHCPATRFGAKHGRCNCGASELIRDFKSAWAKFRKAVKRATQ